MRVYCVLLLFLITGCAVNQPVATAHDFATECNPYGCHTTNGTESQKHSNDVNFEIVAQTLEKAEQGDEQAQLTLGTFYGLGLGVPQSYKESFSWLLKSAQQGDATAQSLVGTLYHDGLGVPVDYTEAAAWYLKSAQQGNADAQNWLGVMYANAEGLPQDYERALTWWNKSAEQGHNLARNNIRQYNKSVISGIPSLSNIEPTLPDTVG